MLHDIQHAGSYFVGRKSKIVGHDSYNESKIIITGKNFGCGSSREHAVWALRDFGIETVIPSAKLNKLIIISDM